MIALFERYGDPTARKGLADILILCSFLHLNGVGLIILPLFRAGKIKLNRPPLRKCRGGQLQAQNGELSEG